MPAKYQLHPLQRRPKNTKTHKYHLLEPWKTEEVTNNITLKYDFTDYLPSFKSRKSSILSTYEKE